MDGSCAPQGVAVCEMWLTEVQAGAEALLSACSCILFLLL